MFLKKDKRPNGRIYLSIVKGFRDPITKKNKQRAVKSIGFLDEFEDIYEDPIEHFKNLAKEMTEEEKLNNAPLEFSFDKSESVKNNEVLRKNFGFVVLSYIYHKLNIDYFLDNKQQSLNIDFSLNKILQALSFLRVMEPCSKKKSTELLEKYFMDSDFSIDDVYRSLDYFAKYKKDLILHIHEYIRCEYGRNLDNVFYDVTNYYFESDEDNFRIKGVSKEHRPNPIVQMGLLMDDEGIPISFKLFEGNTNDCNTLMPVLDELKKDFNFGRVIVVADKGMNTGENIAYNVIHKNGYIYSKSVRGSSKEVKDYILNANGYKDMGDEYKFKSRVVNTNIWITNAKGKKVQVEIEQKQVAFYSEKYARKARKDRQKVLDKANKLIKLKKGSLNKGAYKYIKDEYLDRETGEILEKGDYLYIDEDRIAEEEKYDGYYLIVSSELNMPDREIIERYKGLWKIEESFKITKSQLKSRPVYVRKKDHIEAHFFICFLALILIRLLEKETNYEFSISELINSIKNLSVTYLDENYYMLDYVDNVSKSFSNILNTDITKRFWKQSDIKNLIANSKK
ncbi:IS1634 family transposase [Schnuerera sp. xch1]|uniref:IS1634 family transposase n=1 Tax=Schnuerera sp. xch1 TaxID=2874283 RepID=UPI001CBA9A46|nr:IS1634 family transposase [Schnuerera sp. xch1]MBZ2176061.1 IS1634 family transposase [Schnuerera sp. xch1]